MPNVVGSIPEFTDDGTEEVKPIIPEEETIEETETQPEQTTDEVVPQTVQTTSDLTESEKQGLYNERAKLLKEISELRGQRRELKKEELFQVQEQIATIDDVNPEDVQVVEKVLRAKGYITRDESNKMFYESVKQEEINKFLEKHPEYKPENDKEDLHWQTLNREVGLYKLPENPRLIGSILERAHKSVSPSAPVQNTQAVKRQIQVASAGSSGQTASSSPKKTITSQHKEMLLRGGWTEDEINKMSA